MTDEYKIIYRRGDVEVEYVAPSVSDVLEMYIRAYEDEWGPGGWDDD